MLSRISWGSFLSTMGSLIIIYYTIVLIKFYRTEIKMFMSAILKGKLKDNQSTTIQPNLDTDSEFERAYQLRGEITSMLDQTSPAPVKDELAMALQVRLRNHEEFKGTAFQAAINNHIRTECENKCSIRFSEEEMTRLWEK